MTQDDPRREPGVGSAPEEPIADVAIRPDGYVVEPPLPEQALTSEPVRPGPPADDTTAWREDPADTAEPARRRLVIRSRTRYLGVVAFTLAGLLFGANVVGMVLSNTGSDEAALSIAYVTIFGTILTFLGGVFAAALSLGRGWGVAAVVLSVLANPFVLVVLLGTFSGGVR